jgi:CHASE2 domain-containing sensor protein
MENKKYLTALIKSLFGVGLFYLLYLTSNIVIVKEYVEDPAFDRVVNRFSSTQQVLKNAPNVMLFGVDEYYLKNHDMINELNQTTYGYTFPNDRVAHFIQRLDKFVEKHKEQTPKALFIDYDYSFPTTVGGKELTKEDKIFLEVLKKPHAYSIVLPKSRQENFIESSSDTTIQKLIAKKKIIFSTVEVAQSKDAITRRFIAYKTYKNAKTEEDWNYSSVSLSLWRMFGNDANFTEQSVVHNRFIVKDYASSQILIDEQNSSKSYLRQKSYWDGFYYYSADHSFENLDYDMFKDAIILLGSTTKNIKRDSFKVVTGKKLRGIELQANMIMTHFYLNGGLKTFDIWKSSLLIFVVFYLLFLFGNQFINRILPNWVKIRLVPLIKEPLSFLLIMVVMFLLSWGIFYFYQEWFNWGVAGVLFKGIELWKKIKEYSMKFLKYLKGV